MKTSKAQLHDLSERLRTSATLYRGKADTQDRHACSVDVLAELPEEAASAALGLLKAKMSVWFPTEN